jgi:hypothetical protein
MVDFNMAGSPSDISSFTLNAFFWFIGRAAHASSSAQCCVSFLKSAG